MLDWTDLVCPGIGLLAVALVAYVLFRVRAHHKRMLCPRREEPVLCRHCGYDLKGTEIPRCPECGRAVGFDVTFEQLGIDERDVIDHVRRQAGEPPPSPKGQAD